jgi:regulator of RNase E activity RraB
MKEQLGIPERIGMATNELDIDFSRLTVAGWLTSTLSLATGGGCAYSAIRLVSKRNGLDLGTGLVFCFTMLGVTTVTFLVLRWFFARMGFSITKPQWSGPQDEIASRDALRRMADSGMDMSRTHKLDFWHLFPTQECAEQMARDARQLGYDVASLEPNEESAGVDVQICVELLPSLSAIQKTERTLEDIARRCGGQADGWGVFDARAPDDRRG